MKTANGCTRTPTVRQGKGEEEKMEGEFVRLWNFISLKYAGLNTPRTWTYLARHIWRK